MGDSKGGPLAKGLGNLSDRALLLFSGFVYLFLYAPIFVLVFFSFNSSRNTQTWTGFSFKWYGALLQDQSVLKAFYTSLIVGVSSTIIATAIGTFTALALVRYGFRGKGFTDSIVYAATVMPEIVVGVSLLVFFVAASIPLGITTIIIAHVAFNISFVTIVVRGAALRDGPLHRRSSPGPSARTRSVPSFGSLCRSLLPGVMAGALLAFTLSFDDFVITFFVAGVGSSTLPLKIYSMIKFGVSPVIKRALHRDPGGDRNLYLRRRVASSSRRRRVDGEKCIYLRRAR